MQTLGMIGARISRTNLIIHDGVVDISNETAKIIHSLDVIEKTRNFALLCQRF